MPQDSKTEAGMRKLSAVEIDAVAGGAARPVGPTIPGPCFPRPKPPAIIA